MIAVREFTSAAECIANAAAVRARQFNPKVRPVIKTKPVKHVLSLVQVKERVQPGWMPPPTMFDEHVITYCNMLRSKEIQAKGEIEIGSAKVRFGDPTIRETLQFEAEYTRYRSMKPKRAQEEML